MSINEMQRLAVELVEENFGAIVARVSRCLFRHGPMTLSQIIKRSKAYEQAVEGHAEDQAGEIELDITSNQIRDGLVVLINHNMVLVKAKVDTPDEFQTVETAVISHAVYRICPRRTLMPLRFSRFVSMIRENFGVRAAYLVEELLIMGRATSDLLLERVALRVASKAELDLLDEFKDDFDNSPHTERIREELDSQSQAQTVEELKRSPVFKLVRTVMKPVLAKIVKEKVLERVSQFGAKTADNSQEKELSSSSNSKLASGAAAKKKAASKRKASPKDGSSTKKAKKELEPKREQVVQTFQASAPLMQSLELQILMEREGGVNPTNDTEEDSNKRRKQETASANKRVKLESQRESAHALDDPMTALDDPLKPYWRVSYRFFIQELRTEKLVKFMEQKLGATMIANIVSKLIHYSRKRVLEEWPKGDHNEFELPFRSSVVGTSQVLHDLEADLKAQFGSNAHKMMKVFIQVLMHDNTGVVEEVSPGITLHGTMFPDVQINFEPVIRQLKERCVLDIASTRYGKKAARVLRLLLSKGSLEQKDIGDFAMIPPKEARSILYSLLKGGLLKLQEVSKRPDMAPTHTFYLWSVDFDGAIKTLSSDVYRALFNLKLRRKAMMSRNESLDRRFETLTQEQNAGLITEEELQQVAGIDRYYKLRAALDKLDCTILKLDDTCQLLTVF